MLIPAFFASVVPTTPRSKVQIQGDRPDDVYDDCIRLHGLLKEGRAWLEVRDLFGGDTSLSWLCRLSASPTASDENLGHTLRFLTKLLDVARRALDHRARWSMDALP